MNLLLMVSVRSSKQGPTVLAESIMKKWDYLLNTDNR